MYLTRLTPGGMKPHGGKSQASLTSLSCASKSSLEETNFYNINVSNEEQEDIDMV